jgi:hypothetical protein
MEKIKPVAWGHPNTMITGRKQALMMVELEIPSNAQYPQLWVPLYPPEAVEAAIEATKEKVIEVVKTIDETHATRMNVIAAIRSMK